MKKIGLMITAALLLVSMAACQQPAATSTTASGARYQNKADVQGSVVTQSSKETDESGTEAEEKDHSGNSAETVAEEDRLPITGPADVVEKFEKEKDKYTGFRTQELKDIVRTVRLPNGRITQDIRTLMFYNPDEPMCFEVLDTTINTTVSNFYYKMINGAYSSDYYVVYDDGSISEPMEQTMFTDEEVEKLTEEGLDLSKATTKASESVTEEGIVFDKVVSTEEYPYYEKRDEEIIPKYIIHTIYGPADKEAHSNELAYENIQIDLRDGSIIQHRVGIQYINEEYLNE